MAELIGARIVVLVLLSSKRCEIVAKSRVKPAKMLMLRSLPRTSERITLSLPLPPVLAPGDVDVGGEGMAGPRLGFACGLERSFWFGRAADTKKGAKSSG